jgi:hypothetical protein
MVLHPHASLVQVQARDIGSGCRRAAWESTHWLLVRAGFPFWNIEMWDKKEVFAGVLTAGRVAKVAFDKAGVPAQVLYHNHANFVSSLPFAHDHCTRPLRPQQQHQSGITCVMAADRTHQVMCSCRMLIYADAQRPAHPLQALNLFIPGDGAIEIVDCFGVPAGQPPSCGPHAAGEGPGAAGGLPLPRLRRLPHAGGLLQGDRHSTCMSCQRAPGG